MAKTPSEYALHMIMEGGHPQTVRIKTSKEVNDLIQKIFFVQSQDSSDFLHIPLQAEGEYLCLRPSRIQAVHVEPLFSSSLERY
jgi:hypothetical protein